MNKAKRGQDVMRVVPHGTAPTDGYEPVDLTVGAALVDTDEDKS